jgi:hypothetical protein
MTSSVLLTLKEVIILAPLDQGIHLLPVGCLIVVGKQAYQCGVVSKLDD